MQRTVSAASLRPSTSRHWRSSGGVAAEQAYIDIGFWGGAVPGNVPDLRGLHDAGVFGFKCFLLHSGVDEFPPLDPEGLELALKEIASFGAMMIVHAEDAHAIDRAPSPRGDNYTDFLSSRPRGAENLAIAEVIELARWTGCRVHILHLSSSDALPMIASARRDGVKLTVETCPHYLSFVSEEIPAGATQFKCCPPIREAGNRELLWQGLADGVIDCVVTDHSPCTVDLKRFDIGDFGVAWGGIASLQLSLSAVWSEAKPRGYSLNDVVRWMAENPARLTDPRHSFAHQLPQDAAKEPLEIRYRHWMVVSYVSPWLLRILLLLHVGVEPRMLHDKYLEDQRFQF